MFGSKGEKVLGCKSGYWKNEVGVSFFRPPKEDPQAERNNPKG